MMMEVESKQQDKKAYEPPKLTCYGKITNLTTGGSGMMQEMGGGGGGPMAMDQSDRFP